MKAMKKLSAAAQALGRKGGRSKTPRKLAAVGKNLRKAQAKRTKNYPERVCAVCIIESDGAKTEGVMMGAGVCDRCAAIGVVAKTEELGFPRFPRLIQERCDD